MKENKYVIYHKQENVLISDSNNNVIIFNTINKALRDCRKNEKVICVKDLGIYFKQQIENQQKAKQIAIVSKALAKMLEIKRKRELIGCFIDVKFTEKYNIIFKKYQNICKKNYY